MCFCLNLPSFEATKYWLFIKRYTSYEKCLKFYHNSHTNIIFLFNFKYLHNTYQYHNTTDFVSILNNYSWTNKKKLNSEGTKRLVGRRNGNWNIYHLIVSYDFDCRGEGVLQISHTSLHSAKGEEISRNFKIFFIWNQYSCFPGFYCFLVEYTY